MHRWRLMTGWAGALWLLAGVPAQAQQATAGVAIHDFGRTESTIGPGAPEHVRGLLGMNQRIELDTGRRIYGLCYSAAIDPSLGGGARPGEGYIGMAQPSACNWYQGGFFDLELDGRSLGLTRIHTFTGHAAAGRGYVDYHFDATQAVVRIRFVAAAGGDALFCQVRLEPKQPLGAVRLNLRCYPSAFVSTAERHARTVTRDLIRGQTAALDVTNECALFYYDRVCDQGVHIAPHTGVGPCAALWIAGQTRQARVAVGSYSVETDLRLDPGRREFRFVFLDYAGTANAAAWEDFSARAAPLHAELAALDFTDPRLPAWSPAEQRAALTALLARLPADASAAAQPFDAWEAELATVLPLGAAGGPGAILAESRAVIAIEAWTRARGALALQALLNEI